MWNRAALTKLIIASACVPLLASCASTRDSLSEGFTSIKSSIGQAMGGDKKEAPVATDDSKVVVMNEDSKSTIVKTSFTGKKGYAKTSRKGYAKSLVTQVQVELNGLGYPAGDADGRYRADTEAAIQDFQLANDLTVDGKPSVSLLRVIRASKRK